MAVLGDAEALLLVIVEGVSQGAQRDGASTGAAGSKVTRSHEVVGVFKSLKPKRYPQLTFSSAA